MPTDEGIYKQPSEANCVQRLAQTAGIALINAKGGKLHWLIATASGCNAEHQIGESAFWLDPGCATWRTSEGS